MNKEMVSLKHVSVRLKNLSVLEDINLSIREGDYLGIIGPNGGGKTTLLKIILGLIRITTGIRHVAHCNIGYVPQDFHFDMDFPARVIDVVLMGRLKERRLIKRYNDTDIKIAEKALKAVEMMAYKDYQIGRLSGGQRQLVMIARALAARPQMLILDEPTASIDSQHGYDLYEFLKQLNDEGLTIVMVSHDLSAISTYVKKIACVNRRLYCHDMGELKVDTLQKVYGCSFELLGHGIPHRVLKEHEEKDSYAGNITV